MADFAFDAIKHEYTVSGKRLPSVTQIVNDVVGAPQFGGEWYMQRGSMVHKAIALLLRGKLDETTVDDRIKGRVESARKVIKLLNLDGSGQIEIPLSHPRLLYAGTPDYFQDRKIYDWKNCHLATSEPQLGGYSELLSPGATNLKCFEIVLDEDGKLPVITEYKQFRCRGLFLAMLSVFNWRKNG